MKKLAKSVFMAVCMMLIFLPITALAASQPTSGSCGNGVTWKYEPKLSSYGMDEGGTLTISGNGAMEDYSGPYDAPWQADPSNIKIENGISHIGQFAFYGCRKLGDIEIPASVTSIGASAFAHCYNLSNITIPNSVTSIGESAFFNCYNLNDITIPNSVTSIEPSAFESCFALSNITIPNSVTSIGKSVFRNCTSLTNIELPTNLLRIESNAFSSAALTKINIPASVVRMDGAFYCPDLTDISVEPGNKNYSSSNGLLLDKEGATLLYCPNGKTTCIIPSSVTHIGSSAFYGCYNLTSIEIPSNVTAIGSNAFQSCTKLSSIVIPNSVTTIGIRAFQSCTALKTATLSGGVSPLNNYSSAFYGCTALTTVIIPEGVTRLNGTFNGCTSLTNISFPVSLKSISSNTFVNCTNLKMIAYAGNETQWGAIQIEGGNQELDLATITFNSISLPTNPDTPDKPDTPTVPAQPGTLQLTAANGGLGKKVTVTVTGGHWLTVQVRRAGSVAISSLQAPGSGTVSVTFSAATGSTVQVWETAEEMRFTNGIPDNQILNTATKEL